MSSTAWRNLSLVLGIACVVQLWRSCNAAPAPPTASDCTSGAISIAESAATRPARPAVSGSLAPPQATPAARSDGLAFHGLTVPGWARWLAPHPGEDLRAYRDRMLPLAQAAIGPQRARVARSRDQFAALADLDAHQRAELEAAAQDTATALQERVIGAVLNGEIDPAAFKPMIGVRIARELLDIVDRGDQRFLASLRNEQRAQLARHPFDFGDYLVFSTPWEDALGALD
jgi:hypothetical protein